MLCCVASTVQDMMPAKQQETPQIGEFELAIKAGKIGSMDRPPTFKPFVGSSEAPEPDAFLQKSTQYVMKDKEAAAAAATGPSTSTGGPTVQTFDVCYPMNAGPGCV